MQEPVDFTRFDAVRLEWERERGLSVTDEPKTTRGIVGGQQPDIPASVIVAFVQQVLAVAVAFGAPITEAQSIAVVGLAAVCGSVLMLADARLRVARNERASTDTINELVNGAGSDD